MTIERKLLGTADAAATEANYIEDCFSCYLYTGNGSTQTITNGIDLSTKGGMVWIKDRSNTWGHYLFDTARGASNALQSNTTGANQSAYNGVSAFTSTGFSLGAENGTNISTDNFASWTFRKQPKFFDVVTYTGDGAASKTISHNLGSTPGFVIVKRLDATSHFTCYHRGLPNPNNNALYISSTLGNQDFGSTIWGVSSSTITVTNGVGINTAGGSYVAYLFAHDAGGFGAAGTDSVVACGSYTGNGSASGPTVTLGWEPQYVLIKRTDSADWWMIFDNMRGMSTDGAYERLLANQSTASVSTTGGAAPTATGFCLKSSSTDVNASGGTYIYMAIRRGPMKTPTDATKVFAPVARTGTGSNTTVSTGFPVDLASTRDRNNANWMIYFDRLRGAGKFIASQVTNAENTNASTLTKFDAMSTVDYGADSGNWGVNQSGVSMSDYYFRRAPGFFDVVCYSGTGSATTVAHNLGVAPELMIVKGRNTTADWAVYHKLLGAGGYASLNNNSAGYSGSYDGYFNNTSPTNSVFSVGYEASTNQNEANLVAYLFATCPGVSKVGSYTGNGSSQTINCGFASGARFVLIKRTDSTGSWYVWDSARGIVSGNDPYLLLNSTAAEVTNTDYIDPYSAGFEISSSAPAAINASGGSFIFLAIA